MCLGLGSDTLSLLYLLLHGYKTPAKSPSLCPWHSLLSVSPYLIHLPPVLFVRLEVYVCVGACAKVLSAHVGVCAPLIACMCA